MVTSQAKIIGPDLSETTRPDQKLLHDPPIKFCGTESLSEEMKEESKIVTTQQM